ncbi:sodium:sulfate symporter transmembrane region domain-containing protein [Ditylenchus destructor]|nr:sodium:sulfate symporter transmembrane region domain-containing protein [Ditylenchus destructor]
MYQVRQYHETFKNILALLAPAKCQLLCILLPLILLWIPLCFQSKEASCAYVVLIMGSLWISETLPLAVTALIPVVAFPLLSILTAHKVSQVYLSDSNFVFFGSMIMAVAVESSNLHERIALRILLITGPNPRWLMLGFQLSTSFLSMWISNTATTAMMVPIVIAVIKELDVCQRRQSDPEANMVADDAEEILDLDLVPPRQLSIYKGLLLSICFSASIGGTATLIGTGSNIVLNGYLQKAYRSLSPVTFASWLAFAFPQVVVLQGICWLWLQILYVGFKKMDRSHEGMVSRMLKKKYETLGPIRYEEKNILVCFSILIALWLTREPGFIAGWGNLFTEGMVTDGTAAMSISMLLFVLPAENPLKFLAANQVSTTPIRTIMTWRLMRDKFSWSTLLLLGGGYGMAAGVESSGLSDYIGERLTKLEFLPELVFISVSCIMVTLLTEFSSNVATASIFIPMVASIARIHKTNPLIYILPVTLASSYAFMFPSGTPPNAIVFSVKILRVFDMAIGGSMLNIAAFFLSQFTTNTYAHLIFDMEKKHHSYSPNANNASLIFAENPEYKTSLLSSLFPD